MITHREIASSLLREAREDISASGLLLDGGIYSRSILSSQRVVEQTLKAALIVKDIIITTEHIVSEEFYMAFQDEWDKAPMIRKMAQRLEKEGTKTQYPIFRQTNPPIWIPSQLYTKEDASEALQRAMEIYKEVSSYLRDRYKVEIENGNL